MEKDQLKRNENDRQKLARVSKGLRTSRDLFPTPSQKLLAFIGSRKFLLAHVGNLSERQNGELVSR